MTSHDDPESQAANFLDKVGQLGPNDPPATLDLEWDVKTDHGRPVYDVNGRPIDLWADFSPDEIVAKIKIWMGKVSEATRSDH